MQILVWIFAGLVVGWIAGKSLEGNGYGKSMDLAMGVGGSIAGGLVTSSAGFSGHAGTASAAFMAVCCASLLTIVVALLNGKVVRTRAF